MSRKTFDPVAYSRNSWSYRRWLAYHGDETVEPKNSCEFRSVVYIKSTLRGFGRVTRPLARPFTRKEKPKASPKAPSAAIVAAKKTSKSVLGFAGRVMWTCLWPIRKLCRLMFTGMVMAWEGTSNFCQSHVVLVETILKVIFALPFFALAVVFVVFMVLNPMAWLLAGGIFLSIIVAGFVLYLILRAFFNSDLPAAIGDLFTSMYYGICRKVTFKD